MNFFFKVVRSKANKGKEEKRKEREREERKEEARSTNYLLYVYEDGEDG